MTRFNLEIVRSYVTAIAISVLTTGMLAVVAVAPAAGTASGAAGII
jgi:hypothetical protein